MSERSPVSATAGCERTQCPIARTASSATLSAGNEVYCLNSRMAAAAFSSPTMATMARSLADMTGAGSAVCRKKWAKRAAKSHGRSSAMLEMTSHVTTEISAPLTASAPLVPASRRRGATMISCPMDGCPAGARL